MKNKIDFAHLHCHSQYSVLDGACRIGRLVDKVKKSGMNSIAVTDHGVMSGLPKLQAAADKAGIKPILGIEAYMVPDRHEKKPKEQRYHLTMLAENDEGYKNLCHLSSKAFTEGFYHKPRMDYDLFEQYGKGIIVLTGCMASVTMRALADGDVGRAREEVERLMYLFGEENVYLEIQNAGIKGQIEWNRQLAKIGKELGRPVVATGDVHYLNEEDANPHDVMLCVQMAKNVADANRMKMLPQKYYLKKPEEMLEALPDYPHALAVAQEIADRCNARIPMGQSLLPKFDTPNGEDSKVYLQKLCKASLEKKYDVVGGELPAEVKERLDYELGVINSMGFPDYFLIVADYVQWANDNGVATGPGRGSAAGSLIAYSLGITKINPLDYDLLFERFLNPDRISMPDIDNDFSQLGRDKVIKYCEEKYGHDRVSHICTFGTIGARVGIRDAARAMGLPYSDGDRIAKLVPDDPGTTLEDALRTPDLKKLYDKDKNAKQVIDQALWMEGLVRNAGVHASAILIAPEPLENMIPMRITKSGTKKMDVFNSQYEGTDVDKIGLLKMDFLGLRNLDIIEEAERLIKASTGKDVRVGEVSVDDKKTFEMMTRGDSVGVFQFESSGMQGALREVGVDRFEDMIAIVALYRPGPMAYIPLYAQNKKDPSAIKYLDPRLKPILENTYNIALYQEDLMRLSRGIAGFTPGEADELRKIVGKKLIHLLPDLKKKFIKGCLVNDTSKDVADQLWKLVEAAGSYSFNKSHAACYAKISYETAWLKAHYPTQYMAALLTSVMGTKDKVPFYLYETRRMGVNVMPPDVNSSFNAFTVVGEGELRFGLEAIKNVGHKIIESIVEAREAEGEFKSIWDFARRVAGANKRTMEFLIKAGAFDSFQGSRMGMIEALEDVVKIAKKQRAQGEVTNVGTLFESVEDELAASLGFEDPDIAEPEYPYQEMLKHEYEALGVYASGHPVDENHDAWEQTATATLGKITEDLEGEQVTVVGVVLENKTIYPRRGGKMCFVTLNDPTGTQEIVFFSSVMEVPGQEDVLQEGTLVGVTAKVTEDNRGREQEKGHENDDGNKAKAMKLIAQRAFVFDPSRIPKRDVYYVDVTEAQFSPRTVDRLKAAIKDHPGEVPVKLRLRKANGEKKTYKLGDEFVVRISHELEERVRTIVQGQ